MLSTPLAFSLVIEAFGVDQGAPDISSPYSSGILRAKRLLCSNVYYAGQHSVASEQMIKSV